MDEHKFDQVAEDHAAEIRLHALNLSCAIFRTYFGVTEMKVEGARERILADAHAFEDYLMGEVPPPRVSSMGTYTPTTRVSSMGTPTETGETT